MPVSKEKQKRYPGGSLTSWEWRVIRGNVLAYYGHRCAWCGVCDDSVLSKDTRVVVPDVLSLQSIGKSNVFRVVLTVAHLDHDPTNNRHENLRPLCQKCHLSYDAQHRAETKKASTE